MAYNRLPGKISIVRKLKELVNPLWQAQDLSAAYLNVANFYWCAFGLFRQKRELLHSTCRFFKKVRTFTFDQLSLLTSCRCMHEYRPLRFINAFTGKV